MLILKRLTVGLIGLGGLALLSSGAIAQDTRIGVTAAVNPEVAGTPPSQARRILAVGANVFSQERVVTGARGQTQMLFLDESALTIGPNSDMVLDEFIYDPETETGSLVMNATKGVFRLVGGKISKKNAVLLKTPTATIGIRGGIALTNIADGGATSATFLFGDRMSVTSEGVTKVATRPGYQITVDLGGVPSDPAPVDPAQLVASLDTLESGEDQSGGSDDAPDDSDVAASGVGAAGSANDPSAIAPDGGGFFTIDISADPGCGDDCRKITQDEGPGGGGLSASTSNFQGRIFRSFSRAVGLVVGQGALLFNDSVSGGFYSGSAFTNFIGVQSFQVSFPSTTGEFAVASFTPFDTVSGTGFLTADSEFVFYNLTEAANTDSRELLFSGVPAPTVPTSGTFFYDPQADFLLDSNIPFVPSASGGSLVPALETGEAAIVWDASATNAQRAFGGVLIVFNQDAVGSPTTQDSVASVYGGEVLLDSFNNEPFLDAEMRGSSRLVTSQQAHFFDGPIGTVNTEGDSGDPDGHFFGGDTPDHFVAFGFSNSGASLSSATFGGLDDEFQGTDTAYQPGVVFIRDTTDETIGTRTTRTLKGYSGGFSQGLSSGGTLLDSDDFQNTNSDPADITIDTNASTNKVFATFDVEENISLDEIVVNFGDTGTNSGHSAFIEDHEYGAVESPNSATVNLIAVTDVAYMVTDVEVDATNLLPSGVNFCVCLFLDWGFWGADLIASGGARDRIHLAQWVAGEVATDAQITALSGTATYNGHAIATVKNSLDVYTAVGGFTMLVDFDSPGLSTFDITDFDGGSFSNSGGLALSDVNGLNIFDGTLLGAGVHSGVNGSMRGSFMQGGGSNAAEAGAHWRVTDGSTYTANGIIAAAASVAP